MSRAAFIRYAWITLSVTIAVIVWGAVVRATGSGAGCGSHWPLCNGVAIPLAPRTATIIEFAHRTTSGVSMLLAAGLVVLAFRTCPAGHRARRWAVASLVFMLIEAAVGAGLVLLGLVEHNTSALRAGYIAVHLTNTMLLVGAMTGTIWWARRPDGARAPVVRSGRLTAVLAAMIGVAAAGAIVALGDTLFPSASLAQGLAADLDATSHFLIRLRVIHPLLAVAVALVTLGLARRDPAFTGPGRESIRALVVILLLCQAALGAFNLMMLAPLTLQMAHLLASNLLWIAMVWAWMGTDADRSQLTVNS